MSPATLVTIAKLAMYNQVIKIPVKLATMPYRLIYAISINHNVSTYKE